MNVKENEHQMILTTVFDLLITFGINPFLYLVQIWKWIIDPKRFGGGGGGGSYSFVETIRSISSAPESHLWADHEAEFGYFLGVQSIAPLVLLVLCWLRFSRIFSVASLSLLYVAFLIVVAHCFVAIAALIHLINVLS